MNLEASDIGKIKLPKNEIKFYYLPFSQTNDIEIESKFNDMLFSEISTQKVKLRESPLVSEVDKYGLTVNLEINPLFVDMFLKHLKKLPNSFEASVLKPNIAAPYAGIIKISSVKKQFIEGVSGSGLLDDNDNLIAILTQAIPTNDIGYAVTFTPEILEFLNKS